MAETYQRRTMTNLTRDAAATLVRLLQDAQPIELTQRLDPTSNTFTVQAIIPSSSLVRADRQLEPASTTAE